MIKDGLTSKYEEEPAGEGSWLRTSVFKTTNCIIESTTLEQKCATCNVSSISGDLGVPYSAGYAVKGHVTYIWAVDDEFKDQTCQKRKIFSDEGHLIKMYSKTNTSKLNFEAVIRHSHRQQNFRFY